MDNQHRKISGYRELTQEEIDMMNEVKAVGPILEDLCRKIRDYCVDGQFYEATKWVSLAENDLQTGLMKLTRSIAKPTFF